MRARLPSRNGRRAAGALVALAAALGGAASQASQASQLSTVAPAASARSLPVARSGLSVSPEPGTPDGSTETQISLLGRPSSDFSEISVVGSRSGSHPGALEPYRAATGASFVPNRPFVSGEHVTVRLAWRAGRMTERTSYRFAVAKSTPIQFGGAPFPQTTSHTASYASRPDLHPPLLSVTRRASGSAAGGYVFVAPIYLTNGKVSRMDGQYGPTIYDGAGNLVWSDPVGPNVLAMNFRPQRYLGQPVLTWWQGQTGNPGAGNGEGVILDSSYRPLATVRAGNGYRMDLHEFQITPAGAAWIVDYAPVVTNLSSVGGARRNVVYDAVIQEIDIRTGLVMFEWHELGHIPLRDSYQQYLRGKPWDPAHVNSIDPSRPGEILVSARNTWAIYAVSTRTGRVEWRLGGRHSSFRLGAGARFAWQHDARFQRGGRISLFDDEAYPPVARRESRGIVLKLDARRRTATLAHQYRHRRALFALSQGNEQILPDGDAFEGWGQVPYLSEFSRNGKLLFDARFAGPVESYRSYRFSWTGHPIDLPAAAVRSAAGRATVYASWSGATSVAAWRVLAGPAPDRLAPAASAPRRGFETAIGVSGGGTYFAVQALDSAGRVLATSPTTHP